MVQPDTKPPLGRIEELDAVRGLAALGVMMFHLYRDFWFGVTGVELFFVLSRVPDQLHHPRQSASARISAHLLCPPGLENLPDLLHLHCCHLSAQHAVAQSPAHVGLFSIISSICKTCLFLGGAPRNSHCRWARPGLWPLKSSSTCSGPASCCWPHGDLPGCASAWPCCLVDCRYEGLHGRTLFAHMDGLLLGAGPVGWASGTLVLVSLASSSRLDAALFGAAITIYFAGFHVFLGSVALRWMRPDRGTAMRGWSSSRSPISA